MLPSARKESTRVDFEKNILMVERRDFGQTYQYELFDQE
jgi:hypothetical protein